MGFGCRDAEVGSVLLRPSTKGTSSIMLTIKVGNCNVVSPVEPRLSACMATISLHDGACMHSSYGMWLVHGTAGVKGMHAM